LLRILKHPAAAVVVVVVVVVVAVIIIINGRLLKIQSVVLLRSESTHRLNLTVPNISSPGNLVSSIGSCSISVCSASTIVCTIGQMGILLLKEGVRLPEGNWKWHTLFASL